MIEIQMKLVTPVTAIQRTRLGTTYAAEILLTGKMRKFNVSIILTYHEFRFLVVMGLQEAVFLSFCPNFKL